MKRIICVVLVVLMMAAALTACGGSKSVDLKTVMTGVNTAFGLNDLKTLENAEDLNRYYQINTEDVKSFAAEHSTNASVYTEVILIEAKDATAAGNIKTQLDAHLATQLGDAKSYHADQVAVLEACSTQQVGNYVFLVISDKFADIVSNIQGALK